MVKCKLHSGQKQLYYTANATSICTDSMLTQI